MNSKELIAILERAYAVEQTPKCWLEDITTLIAPHLDAGLGVASYFVDMSEPDGFVTSHYTGTGVLGERAGRALFSRWERMVPTSIKRHVHSFAACGTGGAIPLMDGASIVPITKEAHNLPDMLGLNAIDATGRGCTFAAALPKPKQVPERKRQQLERVAAHLATALRIARKVRESELVGDAVLEADGRVVHCEGSAKKRSSREALRRAAIDMDRARIRHRTISPEGVTDLWRAIVAERWTIVDRFDRDGRRYFIANANVPVMRRQPMLTEREAQIVGAASRGHTNVLIAYELGISASSVATHLRRASRKLGASSRAELVTAFLSLMREP